MCRHPVLQGNSRATPYLLLHYMADKQLPWNFPILLDRDVWILHSGCQRLGAALTGCYVVTKEITGLWECLGMAGCLDPPAPARHWMPSVPRDTRGTLLESPLGWTSCSQTGAGDGTEQSRLTWDRQQPGVGGCWWHLVMVACAAKPVLRGAVTPRVFLTPPHALDVICHPVSGTLDFGVWQPRLDYPDLCHLPGAALALQ